MLWCYVTYKYLQYTYIYIHIIYIYIYIIHIIYIYTYIIYNELNIKWLSNQQLSLGPPHPPRARRATLPKRPVGPLPPIQPSGSTWRNAKDQATPYGLTWTMQWKPLGTVTAIIFYLAKLVYYPLRPGREKMGSLRVATVPNSDVQRHTINYETNQVRCLPSHTAGFLVRTTHTPTWNNLHGGSIFYLYLSHCSKPTAAQGSSWALHDEAHQVAVTQPGLAPCSTYLRASPMNLKAFYVCSIYSVCTSPVFFRTQPSP